MHDWSSFAGEERINKATTNAERKLKGKSFDEGVYQAALKLINYAKNNGITVIGVKYPTTIEYQMAAKRVADINITKQYKYFPVDYVLDYEALLSHQPNLFHDADHLNDVGARLFSRRIAKDISKIAMSLDDSLKVQPIEQWQCEGHYPSQATPGTSAWSAINRWAS